MAKLSRYFMKAITWRAIASLVSMIFLYVATEKIEVVLIYGAIEAAFKVGLYIGHEKLWDFYKGGK